MGFRGARRAGLAVAMTTTPVLWAIGEETPAHLFMRDVVRFADAEVLSVDAGGIVTKPFPAADKPEIAALGTLSERLGAAQSLAEAA